MHKNWERANGVPFAGGHVSQATNVYKPTQEQGATALSLCRSLHFQEQRSRATCTLVGAERKTPKVEQQVCSEDGTWGAEDPYQ